MEIQVVLLHRVHEAIYLGVDLVCLIQIQYIHRHSHKKKRVCWKIWKSNAFNIHVHYTIIKPITVADPGFEDTGGPLF